MKNITFAKLVSTLVLSALAIHTFAAPSNGPKPRCVKGQIAVVEDNRWVCREPSIAAPSKSTALTPARQLDKATPSAPPRALPDLSIGNIMKLNDPTPNVDSFKVYVRNAGSTGSIATKMSISSPKGAGEMDVPAIAANGGEWVTVKFFQFDKGDRIQLLVDSTLKVTESNESNNKHTFNW